MKNGLKSFFIGKPLSDRDLSKEKLNVLWGLPIYSSDAISSVAYAGEEILIVLVAALGFASYRYFIGITLAITLLLLILVISYRQTISAYPQGGGAFIVLIKRHYNSVAEDLVLEKNTVLHRGKTLSKTIVPMSGINRSFVKAFKYVMAIGGELEVYHVAPITEDIAALMGQFESLGIPAKLVIETTEYRNINEVLLRHIKKEESKLGAHEMLTVVMPQIVLRHWWQFTLHNQTTLHLKSAMAKYRRVSVVSIPYLI